MPLLKDYIAELETNALSLNTELSVDKHTNLSLKCFLVDFLAR